MKSRLLACALFATAFGLCTVVKAALNPVGIWNGHVGLSVDAVGSNSDPVGNIRADIPVGATVLAAYLYSAGTPFPWYSNSPTTSADYNGSGITLNGTSITNFVAFTGATALPARPELGTFFPARADVTSLIQSLATGGPNYSWSVQEGTLNNRIDGEVLAVVYSDPSKPIGSVALLDGGQKTGGETTAVSFGAPLSNVSDPSFVADMSIGDSFSYDIPGPGSQVSQINIDGTRLTSAAGGFDDGIGADGGLITAGGIGDTDANPPDPFSNDTSKDDELYSLKPFLHMGDMGFTINTLNPSNDDNIFFMGLNITANVVKVVPNPTGSGIPDESVTALLVAFAGLGIIAARRRLVRNQS
jgi:hypothetical protein